MKIKVKLTEEEIDKIVRKEMKEIMKDMHKDSKTYQAAERILWWYS